MRIDVGMEARGWAPRAVFEEFPLPAFVLKDSNMSKS